MKKVITLLFVAVLLTMNSCMSVKVIGKVNMISNRNVDSKADYVLIRNYMGASDKELRKSKATSIENAIDNTVKNTAGGEFLKNVKVYLVNDKYFAVEGDVWGLEANKNFRGWKVGDKVQWKAIGKAVTGVITDLKDATNASVKQDSDGKVKEVSYDKLTKVE